MQLEAAPVDLAAGSLKVRTYRGEYLWTVEGFSHLDTKTDVDSDEFTLLGHKWKLDLCPGSRRCKHKHTDHKKTQKHEIKDNSQ